MQKLTCFIITPSNRNEQEAAKLLRDDRWGLVELPSACSEIAPHKDALELNFDDVYEGIIKPALEQINTEYKAQKIQIDKVRSIDLNQPGRIVPQIIPYLCSADITITDITTNNPNVFLEYGIRLAVRSELNIMICHEKVDDKLIPFDVRDLRHIPYSLDVRGANKAKDRIVSSIREFIDKEYKEKAPSREDSGSSSAESVGYFKSYIDIHTGRAGERWLARELGNASQLLIKSASTLFTGRKNPALRLDVFEFLNQIVKALAKDPSGHGQIRAVEQLEQMSTIEGLNKERLQEMYLRLSEILSTMGEEQRAKSKEYRIKAEALEE